MPGAAAAPPGPVAASSPSLSPPPPRPQRHGAVLALMTVCVIVVIALVAAINMALPKLAASSLDPSSAQLLWIVDAYVLVFACLLVPAGALGDRRGRKGALLTGLGIFATGCLLAALAPDVPVLIAGRALSGAGAALVMPATLSLALQAAPPDRKAHTVAVWTGATGAAGLVGNLGGGLALQYLPWQGLFWATAPLALLLLVLAARITPRGERSAAAGSADPFGTSLLVLGSFALLTGIIEGPENGWASPLVLCAFAAAVLLLAAFTGYALRAERPLVDPRIFTVPRLRAGALGVAVTFFGLFGLFYVNAQYLQYVRGYSPAVAGLALGPIAVGMILFSRYGPTLVRRWGARPVLATGLAGLAGGFGALSYVDGGTPYLRYAGVLMVISAGMGLALPTLSQAILGALPAERAGLGSGLNSATREFGSALGVAVMGTVMAARLGTGHHVPDPVEFTGAMATGLRVTAVALLLLSVPVLCWFRAPREEQR